MPEKYKMLIQSILLFLVVIGSAFFLGYFLFNQPNIDVTEYDNRFVLFQVGVDLSFVVAILLAIWIWKIKFNKPMKFPNLKILTILFILCLCFFIINPIFFPDYFIRNVFTGKLDWTEFQIPTISTKSELYFILKGLVFAPIYEEVFYRKIIFGKLNEFFTPTFAIVVSSLLFALGHLDKIYFVELFVAGTIFCLIYYKTKSLLSVILFHSFGNFLSSFSVNYKIDIFDDYIYGILFLGGLIGFIYCIRKLYNLKAIRMEV